METYLLSYLVVDSFIGCAGETKLLSTVLGYLIGIVIGLILMWIYEKLRSGIRYITYKSKLKRELTRMEAKAKVELVKEGRLTLSEQEFKKLVELAKEGR